MGETVIQNAEKPNEGGGSSEKEGTGSDVLTAIGETVSNVGANVKKAFDGGSEEESGSETSGGQEEGKDVSGQTLKITDEKLGGSEQRGAVRTLLW